MGMISWLKKTVYSGTNPEQRISIFQQKIKALVKNRKEYPPSVRLVILLNEALLEHFANYYSARKSNQAVEAYRENLEQIIRLCNELEGIRGRTAKREYYNTYSGTRSGLPLIKLREIRINIERNWLNTSLLFPLFEDYIAAFLKAHRINPWD